MSIYFTLIVESTEMQLDCC